MSSSSEEENVTNDNGTWSDDNGPRRNKFTNRSDSESPAKMEANADDAPDDYAENGRTSHESLEKSRSRSLDKNQKRRKSSSQSPVEKSRSRSHSKEKSRSHSKDKSRSPSKDKSRSPSKEKSRSRSKDKDRKVSGSPPKKRARPSRSKSGSKSPSRSRSRSRSRDRGGRNRRRSRSSTPSDGARLHIAELDVDVRKRDLERVFEKFGKVIEIWMARNPPCFAFVVYKHQKDALRALRETDGINIGHCRIKVTQARPRVRGTRSRGYDPSQRCYQCGEVGHFSRNCVDSKFGYRRPSSPQGYTSRRRSRSHSRSHSRDRRRRSSSRNRRFRGNSSRGGGVGRRSRSRSRSRNRSRSRGSRSRS